MPQEAIFRQLIKKLQNVKSTQHVMILSTPSPSPTLPAKKRKLAFKTTIQDTGYDADSSASTELTELPEDMPTDQDSDDSADHEDELGRILEAEDKNFTDQVKARWESFCQNALFFGVWNKSLKPPRGLDKCGQFLALLKALPSMFPSPAAPPKKLGSASEALFHILEPSEDPNVFLQRRPITSPVLLVESTNVLLAVGTVPLTTLPKEMIHEAPLILLGCYYTFHLTYPKCISTLLSIIQTEVLKDSIHERDLTHSYKKAIAEWEEFNKK
ncbi:uncharacterized protein AB9X84_021677 [Acanthopagrus schlegelii]